MVSFAVCGVAAVSCMLDRLQPEVLYRCPRVEERVQGLVYWRAKVIRDDIRPYIVHQSTINDLHLATRSSSQGAHVGGATPGVQGLRSSA